MWVNFVTQFLLYFEPITSLLHVGFTQVDGIQGFSKWNLVFIARVLERLVEKNMCHCHPTSSLLYSPFGLYKLSYLGSRLLFLGVQPQFFPLWAILTLSNVELKLQSSFAVCWVFLGLVAPGGWSGKLISEFSCVAQVFQFCFGCFSNL